MKKLFALLLAAVLLAASAVGFAEEAGGADYAALVLSDPIMTVTENGSEVQYDLSGLSLAFEAAAGSSETLLSATLYGPENAAAAVRALISGEQLILAVDGLSKALSLDLRELTEAVVQAVGVDTTFDFEAMLAELQGMIAISEIAEPQDVEFLNGTAAATGLSITIPREALEYIGICDKAEDWAAGEVSEGDLYAEDNAEITLESVALVIWATDSMSDVRADLAIALSDGSEFPLAALLALDETGESGSFAAYANGAQFLNGGFETSEHIVLVTGMIQTDETETPVTVELEIAEEQPEGSETYDAKRISLSVTEDGETYDGVEVYLCSADQASRYTFTIVADGMLMQLGYDGTSGVSQTGAHETSGVLFFIVTEGTADGITVNGELTVATVSGATTDQLPDLSGLQLLTIDDLDDIDEDSALLNEAIAVVMNAVVELQKIPLIGDLLAEIAEY